jgi:hypothetical protein
VLDRVLVSPVWETQFPLTLLRATTYLGLDHSPLVLDTGTRPGCLPVIFFKKFWPMLRKEILVILNGFALGTVDIARLNFGILSLIPKVPGADNIKQFRPIALINVIFKLVSKAYAFCLSPVAH